MVRRSVLSCWLELACGLDDCCCGTARRGRSCFGGYCPCGARCIILALRRYGGVRVRSCGCCRCSRLLDSRLSPKGGQEAAKERPVGSHGVLSLAPRGRALPVLVHEQPSVLVCCTPDLRLIQADISAQNVGLFSNLYTRLWQSTRRSGGGVRYPMGSYGYRRPDVRVT
jgi:hypothetical protein